MKLHYSTLALIALTLLAIKLPAATHYVDLNSTNPVPPYISWATAATNIQDAVAAAQAGEFVVVADGIYKSGGATVEDANNRVALTNAITLLSLNGAKSTAIVGGVWASQTRCVYVGSNAVLSGFSLVNGWASGSGNNGVSGGGAWCEPSGVISNCVFGGDNFPYADGGDLSNGCSAGGWGGAVYGGTVYNSILANNSVGGYGGAAAAANLVNCVVSNNTGIYCGGLYQGTASNCTFADNSVGGAYQATLYNCTLTNNQGVGAEFCTNYDCLFVNNDNTIGNRWGGGADGGILYDCILSNNTAGSFGGGAYQATLYNCTLVGNVAPFGGGIFEGTAYGCTVISNTALFEGGGADAGTLYNCTLVGNTTTASPSTGGGAEGCMLYNCTLVGNTASNGGGAYRSILYNSIIYYNTTNNWTNYVVGALNYCDTTPMPTDGPGNITNEPLFVDLAGGDFHLQSNSPCINSGNNAYVTSTTDLDGIPRIVGCTVDIGAYEYQTPVSQISYAWLQQYGLPITTNIDTADLDGTGFDVYQDWIAGLNPTNALSVLEMSDPVPTSNPPGLSVSWQSVSGITYFLQSSTNLGTQTAFSTIQSNIPGQAGTTSFTDTSATNAGPYFYRVGVQQ